MEVSSGGGDGADGETKRSRWGSIGPIIHWRSNDESIHELKAYTGFWNVISFYEKKALDEPARLDSGATADADDELTPEAGVADNTAALAATDGVLAARGAIGVLEVSAVCGSQATETASAGLDMAL